MPLARLQLSSRLFRLDTLCITLITAAILSFSAVAAHAASAYVRVNQVGYELSTTPARAQLMSTADETGATFKVVNAAGKVAYKGNIGALLGTWSNKSKTYNIYALDFVVPAGSSYSITVNGPVNAHSPNFAVDCPEALYPGLLLNTLFFYQTQRDGANYIPNALRTAPGHLKDKQAEIYLTPPIDENDYINYVPPAGPLVSADLPKIDVDGGWWDAGDYEKYVETMSYTVALMEIGVRDFPSQMGSNAPVKPPAPPNSISYAGDSGAGAPRSSDFTAEANFGVRWLLKMWNGKTHTLAYQVDNTQDWNYYGEGDPSSSNPNCGGDYSSPYCLITEYDIWTLPQAADSYQQDGDPGPCGPLTTYYICNRPVFAALPPKAASQAAYLSPNLAGRLTAAFAVCYQLNQQKNPSLAAQCLTAADEVYSLADTTYPDPAPYGDTTTCPTCLLTTMPFDGYPEEVWNDDMELGATELYLAHRAANQGGNPHAYLSQAAQFASNYITNIYTPGYSDTLNLYDVSGLAHFELYRAIDAAGDSSGLALTKAQVRQQLLLQLKGAIAQAKADPWGFGAAWQNGDTTSHGAGISVMASEAYALTNDAQYDKYSKQWLGNIMGANSWGSSFIVGDGSTFPNCIQHQVANLAGALDGTSGGTPVLWGAAVEGPDSYVTSGTLDNMNLCPANGVDTFRKFNGNSGAYDATRLARYKDDVQSYSTTEPGIDLTATSFLMWSWRLAGNAPSTVNP
jgi:endoglucanase